MALSPCAAGLALQRIAGAEADIYESHVGEVETRGAGIVVQPLTHHGKQREPRGHDNIDVIGQGFAADCLETLEEVAIRYTSLYRSHGGGELRYVSTLNNSPGHIKALASLLRRHLRGWRPLRVSLEGGCGLEFRPLIR